MQSIAKQVKEKKKHLKLIRNEQTKQQDDDDDDTHNKKLNIQKCTQMIPISPLRP